MIDERTLKLRVIGEDDASDELEKICSGVELLAECSLEAGEGLEDLGKRSASSSGSLDTLLTVVVAAGGGLTGLATTITAAFPPAAIAVALVGAAVVALVYTVGKGVVKIVRAFFDLSKGVVHAAAKGVAAIAEFGVEVVKWAVSLPRKIAASIRQTIKDIAHLGVAILTFGTILKRVTDWVDNFITGAVKLEGINNAFLALAREGAPALLTALKRGSAGMIENIDLMAQYNSAALLVSKTFADTLPEALTYLTKIALATGEDMNYLMDSYVRGVGRLSPKILDNLKIQVSQAEATAWASAEFGKAADQLSVYEKQQGFAAIATEKLEAKTRGLADVTGSLTHLMALYKITTAENAKLLASHFLPVARSFYTVMNKLADSFRESISEGGKWYNILRTTSATISVVIDLVGELADKFSGAGSDAVDKFANKMFEAAWKAFSWGVNIINNLAIGIVRGATQALIAAINFVSNILAYWLGPGSAPRFLPKLVDWGASAFTEYLRGFSEADFGILTGLQAPLRGALQALVGLGMMAQEEVGPMFVALSESMSKALAELARTGQVSEQIFKDLAAVGGGYGKELEELFRRQLAVASATAAVEKAERRLLAAREKETTAGKALSKQAREYNRMLREGASQAELAAKLAEVKASYATLEDAREEADLAEEAKKDAEERAKEATKLMRLQNQLLQQLIAMGQAMSETAEAADKAAKATGGMTPLTPEDLFPTDFAPAIGGIDAAFEGLKERIRAKFVALWAGVEADWAASGVGKLMDELRETWDKSNLKTWWNDFWKILGAGGDSDMGEYYGDVMQSSGTGGLRAALDDLWINKLAPTIQAWLDDNDSWWADVWASFTGTGIRDGSGDVDSDEALTEFWSKLETSLWDALDTLMFDFGVYLGEKFTDLLHGLALSVLALIAGTLGSDDASTETEGHAEGLASSFVEGLWAGLVEGFENKKEFWGTMLKDWFGYGVQESEYYLGMQSPSTRFRDLAYGMIDGLEGGMNEKISQVSWSSMAETIKNAFVTGLSGIGDAIKGSLNSVITVVQNAINNIISGVNQLIWAISSIPGTGWIPYLSYVNLPRLEQGGLITATEQLALLHQHEVVLPLQDPKTVDLMADAMRGAFGQIRDADAAPTQNIKIDMTFGRDSVRSDRDIMMIVDQVQRALELRGVRGGIG